MGRPPKYKTEESLVDKLNEYLNQCLDKNEMPNKAGACLFLDIDKSTYNDYKKKFPHAHKGFENTVENKWVQRLGGNSPTGAIFYLKNAFKEDYRDRNETDLTSGGKPLVQITGMKIIKDVN